MTHRLIIDGELVLYGPVGFVSVFDGDGFTPSEVIAALVEIDGDLTVRLNSGGGFAVDGIAIYNALKSRETGVTVSIDGIAASAASIIAMAGDEIVMRDGALMMIHNASGVTIGTAKDHTKQAEVLGKLDGALARIYARSSGKSASAVAKMMDTETWFDGPEAVDAGFATKTDDTAADEPTAFDYRVYAHAPEKLVARADRVMTAQVTRSPKAKADPSPKPQETEMEMKDVTAAQLRQTRPDLVAEIEAAHDIAPKVAAAEIAAKGSASAAERDRILGIQKVTLKGQEALAQTLIADGKTTPAEAAFKFIEAAKEAGATELQAIIDMDNKVAAVRPAPKAGIDPPAKAEAEMTDDELKAKFAASADLKAEFPTVGAYVAYVNGTRDGRLRILGSKRAA